MIQITETMILRARTYLPLREKEELAAKIAEQSLEIVTVNVENGGDIRSLPPMAREELSVKARYLMGVFVGKYLGESFEPIAGDETKTLMDVPIYDKWAGSHVFDQLERMKRTAGVDPNVKTIIYEILSDFRDVEKRVNAGIYSLINIQNDICSRLVMMIDTQTTPEALQAAGAELEKVKAAIEEYANAKKGGK